MNEISNTKVGDNIHYFVNGIEDSGMVVKMSNSYVTIVKENGQFKDILINETFFVKDIIVNKTWNDMNDGDRLQALSDAHIPSPRYVTKTWDQLPKELQILLTKNNGMEDSAKDGKDDDMNETKRIFDKATNSRGGRVLDTSGKDDRSFGEILDQEGRPDEYTEDEHKENISNKDKALSGDANYKRVASRGSDHASSDAMSTSPKSESGGFKVNSKIGTEGVNDHGQTGRTRQRGVGEREPSAEEQKGEQRGTTQTQAQSDDNKKELATSSVRLFSGYNEQTGEKEYSDKAWVSWLADRKDDVMKDGKDDKGNQFQQQSTSARGKNPTDSDDKLGRADKSWKEMLEEIKSNVEASVHGNAGREPNSGVSTSTNFDAPKDYEGASHSGIRLEQFKHENLKPKVKETLDLGDTKPSDTKDGGNKYDTKTQPKTLKGRAVDQERDKKI